MPDLPKTPKKAGPGSFRRAYRRFLKIHGNPHEIAMGTAMGLFVALTPFMGAHTAVAILLATVFKWNKIAAATGVWLNNPVTMPFLYGASWFVGSRITGVRLAESIPHSLSLMDTYAFLLKTPAILVTFTIGGIVVGIPLAIGVYYLAYAAVKKYQQDRRNKLTHTP